MKQQVSRRRLLASAAAFATLTRPSALRAGVERELPKALLLGDSISIGYTDFVIGMLTNKVDVRRPTNGRGGYENCEGTTKGLRRLDEWLGATAWDVIHFNFGLHDLKHVDPQTGKNSRDPRHPQQANPQQYAKNLESIAARLKRTSAKIIFATTTPYPDDPGGPLRDAGEAERYNQVAKQVMKKHGIAINDLYAATVDRIDDLFPPRNVHPTKDGYRFLAKLVAKRIEESLA